MGNPDMITNARGETSWPAFNCMPIRVANEAALGNNAVFANANNFFNHYPRPARISRGRFLVFAANAKSATLGDGYVRARPNREFTFYFEYGIFSNAN